MCMSPRQCPISWIHTALLRASLALAESWYERRLIRVVSAICPEPMQLRIWHTPMLLVPGKGQASPRISAGTPGSTQSFSVTAIRCDLPQ